MKDLRHEGPVWRIDLVSTHRIGGGKTELQLNSVPERYLGQPR